MLKSQKSQQAQAQLLAGSGWDNRWGLDEERFHDLRHSYAAAAIESGDDIKTVQSSLGHATASFTLDVYGHVSQKMRQQSAERMEQFIHKVSG